MTDLAVGGMDMVPGDGCDAAEMRIALVGLSIDAIRIARLDLGSVRAARRRVWPWRYLLERSCCPNRGPNRNNRRHGTPICRDTG